MAIVRVKNARLAFPDLFDAVQFEGQGPFQYRAALLLAQKAVIEVQQLDGTWKPSTMDAVVQTVATEAWKAKAAEVLKSIAGVSQKMCWYDGSTKDYDGYAGNWVLSMTRGQDKGRPIVQGKDGGVVTQADGVVYAGCFVNATAELWAQDNKFGKAIRATLRAVRFHADGDAFAAGKPLSDDELGDLAAGAGADLI